MTLSWWYPLAWRSGALWLPIAVALTGLAVLVYGAVQQDLRLSANDPQIQLAEDAAARLDAGATASAVVPADAIDLATSLDTYLIVFDATGSVVRSSAKLHGTVPTVPAGVFQAVRQGGQDRITWQPDPSVRSAAVIQPWHGGFVLAGRSLRLVEEREHQVLLLTMFMWLLTLGASAVASVIAAAMQHDGELPMLRRLFALRT